MAKDDKGGKIRVIVVELEGSNETIQESLRTVANALGRPLNQNRAVAPVQQQILPNGNPQQTPTVIDDEAGALRPVSARAPAVAS